MHIPNNIPPKLHFGIIVLGQFLSDLQYNMREVFLYFLDMFLFEVAAVGVVVRPDGGRPLQLREQGDLPEDGPVLEGVDDLSHFVVAFQLNLADPLVQEINEVAFLAFSEDYVFGQEQHWLQVGDEEGLFY